MVLRYYREFIHVQVRKKTCLVNIANWVVCLIGLRVSLITKVVTLGQPVTPVVNQVADTF